jgi:hypothetical protein
MIARPILCIVTMYVSGFIAGTGCGWWLAHVVQ